MESPLYCQAPAERGKLTAKILLIMKMTAVLVLLIVTQVSAKSYAQNVTLTGKNISLTQVFEAIHKQTGYAFVYEPELLKKASPVTINVIGASLNDVLRLSLKEQGLSYEIKYKTIIIRAADTVAQMMDIPSPPKTITGKVTNENGEPLEGVTVAVKDANVATTTNAKGEYTITVPDEKKVLVFSYVGYGKQEMTIDSSTVISVKLQQEAKDLNQVVVVGYGTQKKSSLTGAITSLKSEDFNKGVNTSLDQLMSGKAPGVQVIQNSAEPGGGISVRVRGASSINAGTSPLYVIDGLPLDNSPLITGSGAEYEGTRSPSNPLSSINPADIESIEILKDASATAIYGARGANGVIIITTKKGVAGQSRISYNGYAGIQNVAHKIKLLSPEQYKTVLNDLITEGAASADNTVTDITNGGTDWQSALFQKNAVVQNHDVSITGGSGKTTYYVSLNYFDQDGVVKSSGFDRYGAKANLNMQPFDNLQIGINFNTSYSTNDYVSTGFGINGEAGAIYAALNFDPTLPVTDAEGNYTVSPFLDMDNPLASAYGKIAKANTTRTFGTIFGKYTILPGLSAKLNFGADLINERRDVYVSRLTRHGAPAGGIASVLQAQQNNYLVEGTLSYDKTFGDHTINAVVGATTQRFVNDNTNSTARGFPADATETYNLGLGDPTSYIVGSGRATNRLLSYLGRINYEFKNKYLLTGAFRADGSSRFGANNKFGYFPSVAAAWKISQENFMKGQNVVSTLKLRASWGQTGNQEIGNYAAVSTFSAGPSAILNDQLVSSTNPARIANPDLRWETTEQTDIGLDFGILKERISGSIDYFNKKTFNLLLDLPIPSSTGFSSILSNVGSVRNEGWEFGVTSRNLVGNFKWSTNINLSTIKNKVLSLGSIPQIITGDAGQTSQVFLIKPGLPVYSFYGYQIDGIWQEKDDISRTKDNVHPGDFKYHDVTDDSTVNADDRVILGNSFPKLVWSFGNTFEYKNFQLNIFLEGVQGVSMLNNNLVDAYFPIQFRRNRFAKPYLNRWTPENPSAKYPSFVNPTSQGSKLVNSYTVEDASYARLKTVTLRYTFYPKASFIKNIGVYVTGENLLTLTNYSGYDPAVNPNGGAYNRIDFNAYPVSRNFIFGVSVNF